MGQYINLSVPAGMGAMSTTPPTPETFPIGDQFQPQYINGSSSSFLLDTDNQEDDSEVLVGLGLYSSPDKAAPKTVAEPHIVELYRRAGVELESNGEKSPLAGEGKGLKLEDSWAPPAESEKDEDEEEDADGEQDEETEEVTAPQEGLMGPPLGWL